VTMTNGYPGQSTGGIDRAVRFDTETFETNGTMTFRMKVQTACSFTYTAAAFTTQPPNISVVSTTNC
jgi:hypothetical protein